MNHRAAVGAALFALVAGTAGGNSPAVLQHGFSAPKFGLEMVGLADASFPAPVFADGANLPDRIRSTEFGRAFLLAPDYLQSEFSERLPCLSLVAGGKPDYRIHLRFQDPGYLEQTNETLVGGVKISVRRSQVLNGSVADSSGKVVFSRTVDVGSSIDFEPSERPTGNNNESDRLVRRALAEYVDLVGGYFTSSYQVVVKGPEFDKSFDTVNVLLTIDGVPCDPGKRHVIANGVHSVKVECPGYRAELFSVDLRMDARSIVRLKREDSCSPQ